MSNNTEVPVTTIPQTSHLDGAVALIDDIRAMKLRVPNFVVPETRNAGRQLASAASVPPQFVDLAALAIRNNEEQLTLGRTSGSVQMRNQMDFADAYDPVADELEALAHFVRHSVRVARNSAGSNALLTYAVAQRLAKRPETASLAPHVQDMRNALGARRKAKAKPAPTPGTPVPSTPTAPSPVTPSSPTTAPKTA